MTYLDELLCLEGKTVSVQILESERIDVSYSGRLTQVNEDTERFVLAPKFVYTTIDGKVYEAPYSQNGSLTLGFDIDNVCTVEDDVIVVKDY